MTDPLDQLEELTAQLEAAAARLRSGEIDAEAAAGLIDDCAALAGRAAAELDRAAEAAEPGPAQDSLL